MLVDRGKFKIHVRIKHSLGVGKGAEEMFVGIQLGLRIREIRVILSTCYI